MMPRRSRTTRRWARPVAGALLAATAVLTLSACSEDPNSVAGQAQAGDQKGYVSGSGQVEIIPAGKRGEPVVLDGPTIDGATFASADHRDKLLVINVWASWCPPCKAEAPDLAAVATDADIAATATFVGINVRDSSPATALAAAKAWGMPYPSLSDPDGQSGLTLQGKATALPSTVVLDTEGRIAARVLGSVTKATLTGMIEDVAAGGSRS